MSAEDLTRPATSKVLERRFSKDEVVKAYSRVAWMYNVWARFTESKAVNEALQLADIRDGEKVLEVAVGTGAAFEEVAQRNTHGRNEGIDLSPAMLDVAKKRMKSYNTNNCNLQLGNAYHLPFSNEEFDLVFNSYMLDLLPESDFVTILREFSRVLRPSGRLILVTMAFGKKWYNHIWEWVAGHFPALLTNCRPVFAEKYLSLAGFNMNPVIESISQNTVPSHVIRVSKP